MRASLKKKGSLSLSINAIVVLIMAITMLGLGLAFMRNTFKSAASSMEGATAEIEKQTIDSLKSSGKKVGVSQASLELGPKEKKGVIVAVTNTLDSNSPYYVEYKILGCSGAYETSCTAGSDLSSLSTSLTTLKFTLVENMGTILEDDAKTVTLGVETTSGVAAGTITMELLVYQGSDNTGPLHGAETVTITTVTK